MHVLDGVPKADDAPAGGGVDALRAALERYDPDAAVAVARHLLAEDPPTFAEALRTSCLFTPLTRPIFVQHHVKTVLAAERLAGALAADPLVTAGDGPGRWMTPWLGTVRWLAHRHRERRVRDAVRWASAFVQRGEMRGNLLGY